MRTLHLVLMLACIAEIGSVSGDEFIETKKGEETADKTTKPEDKSEKTKIIREFFENEGMFIGDEPSADFIGKFDDELVTRMADVLAKEDFLEASAAGAKVNSLIYSKMLKLKGLKVEEPYEVADEALFRALDLIVPNCPAEPELEKAKKELRKFFEEQNELCRELLDRISYLLDAEELHTHKAVEFLLGSYYSWIPLGRLGEFIDKADE